MKVLVWTGEMIRNEVGEKADRKVYLPRVGETDDFERFVGRLVQTQ
jgi:hypothetical protein